MKPTPLSELEMFELLRAAYPEKFHDDDDVTWADAQVFAESINGWIDVADLLGRVVMLTMPMESLITGTKSHCLGEITFKDGNHRMTAAVKRHVETKQK